MSIHCDLESIKMLAQEEAKNHNCIYIVILMNPDDNGEFDARDGSTYEFVRESYFEKPRPNAKKLFITDGKEINPVINSVIN